MLLRPSIIILRRVDVVVVDLLYCALPLLLGDDVHAMDVDGNCNSNTDDKTVVAAKSRPHLLLKFVGL